MTHEMFSIRRSPVLSTLGLAWSLLLLVGCTGNGTNPANSVLGTVANAVRQNTVTIRVTNITTSNVEAEIRVDGVIKVLPPCTAIQRTCTYLLTTCPSTVELIQETRRDFEGTFMGGRNFEGNPDFTFTPGEFECGDTIMFEFSDSRASATVM